MPELTLENIDQISRDIRRQEISFSHLFDDLIDHVCCDVEYEMQSGLGFLEAYQRVRQKMGSGRRLKEIQEETLYAVDTKYRQMKNTMKISGIAGTVLLGFAALFKIQHWPLAGAMLTLGAFTLAFIFMPSALGVLWKETHSRKRVFLFISAFLAGFFFISGTLFKVQHWPGSGLMITLAALFGILFFVPALLADKLKDTEKKSKRPVYILGAIGVILYLASMLFKIMHWPLATVFMVSGMLILCIVALPWFTWLTWKEDKSVSAHFIYIVIGMFIIVLPGALVSLNLQHSYEAGFFPHLERQQMIYNVKSDQNNQLLVKYQDSLIYPQMEKIHSRTADLLLYISDIQVKMVQDAEGEPGNPAVAKDQISETEQGTIVLYRRLSDPFTKEPVKNYLLSGSESRQNLESEISRYSEFISELQAVDNHDYSWPIEASDSLTELLPGKTNVSMISGLHSLELMKNTLLFIESELLDIAVSN
jgi:hypothetical protein